MRRSTIKIGGFLMMVGVMVAMLSVKNYFSDRRLASAGVEAMADVVRVISDRDSRQSLYIELPDANKTGTILPINDETQGIHPGQKVKVVYDPEHPINVKVGGKEKLGGGFFSMVLRVLLGLATSAGGFFWLAYSGRRET